MIAEPSSAPVGPELQTAEHDAELDGEADEPLEAGIEVVGLDESDAGDLDLDRWCRVAERALQGEGIAAGRLDLVFVDLATMASLNAEHMGHDGPTDVLAFPLDGPAAMAEADPGVGNGGDALPTHLGDVVVCPQRAAEQAPDHAGTLDAELTLLVVHGVLHVLGHDHAEPDEMLVMQARERWHLARDGIPHPVPVST